MDNNQTDIVTFDQMLEQLTDAIINLTDVTATSNQVQQNNEAILKNLIPQKKTSGDEAQANRQALIDAFTQMEKVKNTGSGITSSQTSISQLGGKNATDSFTQMLTNVQAVISKSQNNRGLNKQEIENKALETMVTRMTDSVNKAIKMNQEANYQKEHSSPIFGVEGRTPYHRYDKDVYTDYKQVQSLHQQAGQNAHQQIEKLDYSKNPSASTHISQSALNALRSKSFTFFDTETIGERGSSDFSVVEAAVIDQAGQEYQYFTQLSNAAAKQVKEDIETISKNGRLSGENIDNRLRSIKRLATMSKNAQGNIVSNYTDMEKIELDADSRFLDLAKQGYKLMTGSTKTNNLVKRDKSGNLQWNKLAGGALIDPNSTLIAWNGGFDIDAMSSGRSGNENFIDPRKLFARAHKVGDIDKKQGSGSMLTGFTLNEVADFYGIDREGMAHVGLSDTKVLKAVWEQMMQDKAVTRLMNWSDTTANGSYTPQYFKKGKRYRADATSMITSPLDYITDEKGNIIEETNKNYWEARRGMKGGHIALNVGMDRRKLDNGGYTNYVGMKDEDTGYTYWKAGSLDELANYGTRYTEIPDTETRNAEEIKNDFIKSGFKYTTLKSWFDPSKQKNRSAMRQGELKILGGTDIAKQLEGAYKIAESYAQQGWDASEIDSVLNSYFGNSADTDNLSMDNLINGLGGLQAHEQAGALLKYVKQNPKAFNLSKAQLSGLIESLQNPNKYNDTTLYNLKRFMAQNLKSEALTNNPLYRQRFMYNSGVDATDDAQFSGLKNIFNNQARFHVNKTTNSNGVVSTDYVQKMYDFYSQPGRNNDFAKQLSGEAIRDRLKLTDQNIDELKPFNQNAFKNSPNTLGYQIQRIADHAANNGYKFSMAPDSKTGLAKMTFSGLNGNGSFSLDLPTADEKGDLFFNNLKTSNFLERHYNADTGQIELWDAQTLAAKSLADYVTRNKTVHRADGTTFSYSPFGLGMQSDEIDAGALRGGLSARINEALSTSSSLAPSAVIQELDEMLGIDDLQSAESDAFKRGFIQNASMYKEMVLSTDEGKEALKQENVRAIEAQMRQLILGNYSWIADKGKRKELQNAIEKTYANLNDKTVGSKETAVNVSESMDTLRGFRSGSTYLANIFPHSNLAAAGAYTIGRTTQQAATGVAKSTEEATQQLNQMIQEGYALKNTGYTKQEETLYGANKVNDVYSQANRGLVKAFAIQNQDNLDMEAKVQAAYRSLSDKQQLSELRNELRAHNIADFTDDELSRISSMADNALKTGVMPSLTEDSAIYVGRKSDQAVLGNQIMRNKRVSEDIVKKIFNNQNLQQLGLKQNDLDNILNSWGSTQILAGNNKQEFQVEKDIRDEEGHLLYKKGDYISGLRKDESGQYRINGRTNMPVSLGRVMLGNGIKTTNTQLGDDYDETFGRALKFTFGLQNGYGGSNLASLENVSYLINGTLNKDARKTGPLAGMMLKSFKAQVENFTPNSFDVFQALNESIKKDQRFGGAELFDLDAQNKKAYLRNNFGGTPEGAGALLRLLASMNSQENILSQFAQTLTPQNGKGFVFDPNMLWLESGITAAYDYYKSGDKYKWGARSNEMFTRMSNEATGKDGVGLISEMNRIVEAKQKKNPLIAEARAVQTAVDRTNGEFTDKAEDQAQSPEDFFEIVTPEEAQVRTNRDPEHLRHNFISAAELAVPVRDEHNQILTSAYAGSLGEAFKIAKEQGLKGVRINIGNGANPLYLPKIDRSEDVEANKGGSLVLTSAEQNAMGVIEAMQRGETAGRTAIMNSAAQYLADATNSVYNKEGSLFAALNNPALSHATWYTARGNTATEGIFAKSPNAVVQHREDIIERLIGYDASTGQISLDKEEMGNTYRNLLLAENKAKQMMGKTDKDLDDGYLNETVEKFNNLKNRGQQIAELRNAASTLVDYADIGKYGLNAIPIRDLGMRLPGINIFGEYLASTYAGASGQVQRGQAILSNPFMKLIAGDFDADTFRMLGIDVSRLNDPSDTRSYSEKYNDFIKAYNQQTDLTNSIIKAQQIIDTNQALGDRLSPNATSEEIQKAQDKKQKKAEENARLATDKDILEGAELYAKYNKPLTGIFSNRAESIRKVMDDKDVDIGSQFLTNAIFGTPEQEAISAKHAIDLMKDAIAGETKLSHGQTKEQIQKTVESAQMVSQYLDLMKMGAKGADIKGLFNIYREAGWTKKDGDREYLQTAQTSRELAAFMGTYNYHKDRATSDKVSPADRDLAIAKMAEMRKSVVGSEVDENSDAWKNFVENAEQGRMDLSVGERVYNAVNRHVGENGKGLVQQSTWKQYKNGHNQVTREQALAGLTQDLADKAAAKGFAVSTEHNTGAIQEPGANGIGNISAANVNMTATNVTLVGNTINSVTGNDAKALVSKEASVLGMTTVQDEDSEIEARISEHNGNHVYPYSTSAQSVSGASTIAGNLYGGGVFSDYENPINQIYKSDIGTYAHLENEYRAKLYSALGIDTNTLDPDQIISIDNLIKTQVASGVIKDDNGKITSISNNAFAQAAQEYLDQVSTLDSELSARGISDEEINAAKTLSTEEAQMIGRMEAVGQFGKKVASEVGLSGNFGGNIIGAQADAIYYDEKSNTFTVGDYKTGHVGHGKVNLQTSQLSHLLESLYGQVSKQYEGNNLNEAKQFMQKFDFEDLMAQAMAGTSLSGSQKRAMQTNANSLRDAFAQALDAEKSGQKVNFGTAVYGLTKGSDGKVLGGFAQKYNRQGKRSVISSIRRALRGESLTSDETKARDMASISEQDTVYYNSQGQQVDKPNKTDNGAIKQALNWERNYGAAQIRLQKAQTDLNLASQEGDKTKIAELQQIIQLETQRLALLEEQRVMVDQDKKVITRNKLDANGRAILDDKGKPITETIGTLDDTQLGMYNIQSQMQKAANAQQLRRAAMPKKSAASFLSSVFGNIKQTFEYLTRTSIVYGAIGKIKQAFMGIVQAAQQLNAEIVNLQIASGKNKDTVTSMVKSYGDLAAQLGKTTQEATQAANDWLRAGYDTEKVSMLIASSLKLSTLGQMESAEATKALISAMKGWKLSAEDISGVVDKLTALDLEYATSAGEIATAMSKGNVSASLAGMDMDTYMAMLTTVMDVGQQGADVVGTAFRSMMARYGNVKSGKYKVYREDGGEEESLNDTEAVLSSIGITMRDATGGFKDLNQTLDEIAKKWYTLSDIDRNAITTALGGTRQRETLNTLFENYESVEKAKEIAQNSEGSANTKMTAYTSSIEAAKKRFANATERISQGSEIPILGDLDDILVKIYNLGTDLIKNLDNLIKIGTALLVIFKGPTLVSAAGKGLMGLGSLGGLATKQIGQEWKTTGDILGSFFGEGTFKQKFHDAVNILGESVQTEKFDTAARAASQNAVFLSMSKETKDNGRSILTNLSVDDRNEMMKNSPEAQEALRIAQLPGDQQVQALQELSATQANAEATQTGEINPETGIQDQVLDEEIKRAKLENLQAEQIDTQSTQENANVTKANTEAQQAKTETTQEGIQDQTQNNTATKLNTETVRRLTNQLVEANGGQSLSTGGAQAIRGYQQVMGGPIYRPQTPGGKATFAQGASRAAQGAMMMANSYMASQNGKFLGQMFGNGDEETESAWATGVTSASMTASMAASAIGGKPGLYISLITLAVNILLRIWDINKETQAEQEEAAAKMVEELQTLNENIEKSTSLLDALTSNQNRLNELSKGVNQYTGENISLSEAEYNEYQELLQYILEANSKIYASYGANGEIMLKNAQGVVTLNDAMAETIKLQKEEVQTQYTVRAQSVSSDGRNNMSGEVYNIMQEAKKNSVQNTSDQIWGTTPGQINEEFNLKDAGIMAGGTVATGLVGAGAGAALATALIAGLKIGASAGSVAGPVGAIIGAAIGVLAGGIVHAAVISDDNKQREEIGDTLKSEFDKFYYQAGSQGEVRDHADGDEDRFYEKMAEKLERYSYTDATGNKHDFDVKKIEEMYKAYTKNQDQYLASLKKLEEKLASALGDVALTFLNADENYANLSESSQKFLQQAIQRVNVSEDYVTYDKNGAPIIKEIENELNYYAELIKTTKQISKNLVQWANSDIGQAAMMSIQSYDENTATASENQEYYKSLMSMRWQDTNKNGKREDDEVGLIDDEFAAIAPNLGLVKDSSGKWVSQRLYNQNALVDAKYNNAVLDQLTDKQIGLLTTYGKVASEMLLNARDSVVELTNLLIKLQLQGRGTAAQYYSVLQSTMKGQAWTAEGLKDQIRTTITNSYKKQIQTELQDSTGMSILMKATDALKTKKTQLTNERDSINGIQDGDLVTKMFQKNDNDDSWVTLPELLTEVYSSTLPSENEDQYGLQGYFNMDAFDVSFQDIFHFVSRAPDVINTMFPDMSEQNYKMLLATAGVADYLSSTDYRGKLAKTQGSQKFTKYNPYIYFYAKGEDGASMLPNYGDADVIYEKIIELTQAYYNQDIEKIDSQIEQQETGLKLIFPEFEDMLSRQLDQDIIFKINQGQWFDPSLQAYLPEELKQLMTIADGLDITVVELIDHIGFLGNFTATGVINMSVDEVTSKFELLDQVILDIGKDGKLTFQNLSKIISDIPELLEGIYADDNQISALLESAEYLQKFRARFYIGSLINELNKSKEATLSAIENKSTNSLEFLSDKQLTSLKAFGTADAINTVLDQYFKLNADGSIELTELGKTNAGNLYQTTSTGDLDWSQASILRSLGVAQGLDTSSENFTGQLFENLITMYQQSGASAEELSAIRTKYSTDNKNGLTAAANAIGLWEEINKNTDNRQKTIYTYRAGKILELENEKTVYEMYPELQNEFIAEEISNKLSSLETAYQQGRISADAYTEGLQNLINSAIEGSDQLYELKEKLEEVNYELAKTDYQNGIKSLEEYIEAIRPLISLNAEGTEDYETAIGYWISAYGSEISKLNAAKEALNTTAYAAQIENLTQQESLLYDKSALLINLGRQKSEEYLKTQSEIKKNLEEQAKIRQEELTAQQNILQTQYDALSALAFEEKRANLQERFALQEQKIAQAQKDQAMSQEEYANLLKEAIEYRKQELELVISMYETQMDAAVGIMDYEIELLNRRKDAVNDYYNDEISKLEEVNNAKQRSIEYEEKLQALENAKKEKKRVYVAGVGFTYQADQTAVQKAKRDLNTYLDNQRISDLKNAQTKSNEMFSDLIDKWQDMKNLVNFEKTTTETEGKIADLLNLGFLTNTENSEDIASAVAEVEQMFDQNHLGKIIKIDSESSLGTIIKGYDDAKNAFKVYEQGSDPKLTDIYTALTGVSSTYTQGSLLGNVKAITDSISKIKELIPDSKSSDKVDTNTDTDNWENLEEHLNTIEAQLNAIIPDKKFTADDVNFAIRASVNQLDALKNKYNTTYTDTETNKSFFKIGTNQYIKEDDFKDRSSKLDKDVYAVWQTYSIDRSYSSGIENGAVDYTGLAMLHGTPTNPEYVLNSQQAGTLLKNLATIELNAQQLPKAESKQNQTSEVNNFSFDKLVLPNVTTPDEFMQELLRQTKTQFSTRKTNYGV